LTPISVGFESAFFDFLFVKGIGQLHLNFDFTHIVPANVAAFYNRTHSNRIKPEVQPTTHSAFRNNSRPAKSQICLLFGAPTFAPDSIGHEQQVRLAPLAPGFELEQTARV
jgi:hypothetical protein